MLRNVAVLAAVLLVATAIGYAMRRHSGHFRGAPKTTVPGTTPDASEQAARPAVDPGELAQPTGERATLLQFSSAFCAPCRATRRILGEVAAAVPGVAHVEVDAEHHLDLVRRLGILRTPTTLVLDAGLREVTRAAGVPSNAAVLAALAHAVEGAPAPD